MGIDLIAFVKFVKLSGIVPTIAVGIFVSSVKMGAVQRLMRGSARMQDANPINDPDLRDNLAS
jgi:hypothetical protein